MLLVGVVDVHRWWGGTWLLLYCWLYIICSCCILPINFVAGFSLWSWEVETGEFKPPLYCAHPLWTCLDQRTEKLDHTLLKYLLTRESQWAEEERSSSIRADRARDPGVPLCLEAMSKEDWSEPMIDYLSVTVLKPKETVWIRMLQVYASFPTISILSSWGAGLSFPELCHTVPTVLPPYP